MLTYIVPPLILVAGLCVLIWSANLLVRSAQSAAISFGISRAVIGAIVLGFGTSLPELAISFGAAINQVPAIAYGNAIGSNIANTGLILGIAAVLSSRPVLFSGRTLRNQLLLSAMATLLFLLLSFSGTLGTWQAIIFLCGFVLSMWIILRDKHGEPDGTDQESAPKTGTFKLLALVGLGIVGVTLGSRLTVIGAQDTSTLLGIPQQLVALSLIAFGTSLPELVVTIRLTLKKEPELIIGNLLGSNIFNLLLVLPVAHLFIPLHIPFMDFIRDGGALLGITGAMLLLCFPWKGTRHLTRAGGWFLLFSYCAYIVYIAVVLCLLCIRV